MENTFIIAISVIPGKLLHKISLQLPFRPFLIHQRDVFGFVNNPPVYTTLKRFNIPTFCLFVIRAKPLQLSEATLNWKLIFSWCCKTERNGWNPVFMTSSHIPNNKQYVYDGNYGLLFSTLSAAIKFLVQDKHSGEHRSYVNWILKNYTGFITLQLDWLELIRLLHPASVKHLETVFATT